MILCGDGNEAFCAGADLKAIESFWPRIDLPEGPLLRRRGPRRDGRRV